MYLSIYISIYLYLYLCISISIYLFIYILYIIMKQWLLIVQLKTVLKCDTAGFTFLFSSEKREKLKHLKPVAIHLGAVFTCTPNHYCLFIKKKTLYKHSYFVSPSSIYLTPSIQNSPYGHDSGRSFFPTCFLGYLKILIPAICSRNAWYEEENY